MYSARANLPGREVVQAWLYNVQHYLVDVVQVAEIVERPEPVVKQLGVLFGINLDAAGHPI